VLSNSSAKTKSRTLAGSSRAHNFLEALANLRDEPAAIQRFERQWRYLFEPEVPIAAVFQWAIQAEEEDVVHLSPGEKLRKYWLLPLRAFVRHLWAGDTRTKQIGIAKILERFFGIGFRDPAVGPWTADSHWFQASAPPPESSCERIVRHLGDRTSVCANADCPAPYFFAIRRGQKYCSEVCAGPAQREFKRSWWRDYGPAWRAQRTRRARGIKATRKR